ncbi:ribonuclease HI family protein [Halobacillus shinanisalinarum]|uniref:Ribonuclease HI family protein n=1 Tax=Halobacillus shinanisalinarum TaxID=2932258 RepID=A0ABY4GZK5_9BACI|nr:ribonuclease HI family protein [Halobacillus shinanisalinarum]UOQ93529.1 ribonuclease HI family protein [Halobacillus shinanisalinarum]
MIEVYTDASTIGNPGPSAAGIYIKQKNQQYEYSYFLGEHSNHEAEFLAVIRALEICKQTFPGEILSIRSDSQVVVTTVDKSYTNNPVFVPLLNQILTLHDSFSFVFYKWIPDKANKNADRLARSALKR